jgi:hypothetical protein
MVKKEEVMFEKKVAIITDSQNDCIEEIVICNNTKKDDEVIMKIIRDLIISEDHEDWLKDDFPTELEVLKTTENWDEFRKALDSINEMCDFYTITFCLAIDMSKEE